MSAPVSFDLGLGLEGTHILITGGAGLIGTAVVAACLSAGARVSSLDISHNANPASAHDRLLPIHADISSPSSLSHAWAVATTRFGTVEVCVALAALDLSVLPQTASIADADPATWARVLDVNVKGTMLTAQAWLRGLRAHDDDDHPALRNPGLILMGSEAGHFGVRTCAAYAAAKAAVQYGLLQSLRADAPRICPQARVNAVAPGAVDTVRFREETGGRGSAEWWAECQATTALAQPVPVEAVARTVLFLASRRWSGNIHGKCVDVDSGKMGAVMWRPEEVLQRDV